MTTDEAREAAWREWFRVAKHQPFLVNVETGFDAGWDARGEYDAQQIAALVAEVQVVLSQVAHDMMDTDCPSCGFREHHQTCVYLALEKAYRALAAWVEEATE